MLLLQILIFFCSSFEKLCFEVAFRTNGQINRQTNNKQSITCHWSSRTIAVSFREHQRSISENVSYTNNTHVMEREMHQRQCSTLRCNRDSVLFITLYLHSRRATCDFSRPSRSFFVRATYFRSNRRKNVEKATTKFNTIDIDVARSDIYYALK